MPSKHMQVEIHLFLTSALDRGETSTSQPGCLRRRGKFLVPTYCCSCRVYCCLFVLYVLLQLSCVYCCQLSCVYFCSCLVCIVVVVCIVVYLSCMYCCSCLVFTVVSCLVCIVVVVLCVLLSYMYLLYYVGISIFYFRRRTAGQKSVFGRSCDRPPRHRFFLVSLCLKANAEMVPKIPSCHYMLLMQPSRLKFISN